jgi:hypothetical protein
MANPEAIIVKDGKEVELVVKTIKQIEKSNVTICGWAPPSYGDTGQTILHTLLAAVSFAVAVWSVKEQLRVFNMRRRLADGYAAMAEYDWNRFNDKYKPLENQMINECLSESAQPVDYEGVRSVNSAFHSNAVARADALYAEIDKQYRLCPDPSLIRSLETERSVNYNDLINFGYREGELFAIDFDDMRFNRRSNLLNLGRDLASKTATYGEVADKMLSEAGDGLSGAVTDAMSFLGYIRNKRDTVYPFETNFGALDIEKGRDRGDLKNALIAIDGGMA